MSHLIVNPTPAITAAVAAEAVARDTADAGPWIALGYAAGWGAIAGAGVLRYRLEGGGRVVRLSGSAQRASGVIDVAATLPVGARPTFDLFPPMAINGGGVGIPLSLQAAGAVSFFANQAAGVYFDGITFPTT